MSHIGPTPLKIRFLLKIVGACILLAVLAAVAIVADLLHYSRPVWPKIRDEARLIADAHLLISTHPTSAILSTDWPESIRSLNPKAVLVQKDEYIEVVISGGGIGQPYSYIIFRSPADAKNFNVPYRKLHPTQNPLVFTLS